MGLAVIAVIVPMAACTQLAVRSVSPDPNRPFYELRGPDLLALKLEASRLCPAGFVVQRQWESSQRLEGNGWPARWWNKAMSGLDDDGVRAELTVACKIAAPAV